MLPKLIHYALFNMQSQSLLDYERHKTKGGELTVAIVSQPEPLNIENQV